VSFGPRLGGVRTGDVDLLPERRREGIGGLTADRRGRARCTLPLESGRYRGLQRGDAGGVALWARLER